MKFTARLPQENHNVSSTHPLIELAWLLGGLVFVVGLVFLVLGLLADLAVSRIPVSLEKRLGDIGLGSMPASEENGDLTRRLEELLVCLPDDSPLHQYTFHVYLSGQSEVNAVALPGGVIVVYRGLLKEVESENELAMVLAHELGHFAHRDHLRGLGRGLGVVFISTVLFGQDSSTSDLVAKTLLSYQSGYSKEQEEAADQFGLECWPDVMVMWGARRISLFVSSVSRARAGSLTCWLRTRILRSVLTGLTLRYAAGGMRSGQPSPLIRCSLTTRRLKRWWAAELSDYKKSRFQMTADRCGTVFFLPAFFASVLR